MCCLQEDLWRQVLAGSLPQYRRIVGPLQLAPTAVRGRGPAAVPVRLHLRRDAGGECEVPNGARGFLGWWSSAGRADPHV